MNESHQSYAKDFEASTEDVDLIVERSNTSGAEGARLTGGGFGGEGTVTKFAESLGPVRTTNFGKHFDVVSKPDPNDLAYTSLGLTAHTDNPYRKPIPGIQILHCSIIKIFNRN